MNLPEIACLLYSKRAILKAKIAFISKMLLVRSKNGYLTRERHKWEKQLKQHLLTLFGFTAVVLIWGSFPIAAKIAVHDAPPLILSGTRFCSAFMIMAVITLLQRKKLRLAWREHRQVCLISLLMVGIPSSIFFAATPYAPVGVLTVMWAPTPIFTALFNIRGAGEVRGWRVVVSMIIGLVGILIVLLGHIPFWPGATDGTLTFASTGTALIGELGVFASSAVYGLGIRLAKQNTPHISIPALTTWQLFYSSVFLVILGLFVERGHTFTPGWTTVGALLYLIVFCSCISFFLTFWLIRRIGAIRTAYSDFLIPGVTLILSYLLLGESLTLAKVVGLVLVVIGLLLVGTQGL